MKTFIEEAGARSGRTKTRAITYMIENGCYVCTSHKTSEGYPVASRGGKTVRLHRYVWEKYNGPIPDGACILHQCDNRKCINPHHLHLGSLTKNMNEAWERNRFKNRAHSPSGEDNSCSKLTSSNVREILNSEWKKGDRAKLARKFGVTPTAVYLIRYGKNWKHMK